MEKFRPVWTEINLDALRRNYLSIANYTKSELMPIVKADAYGHGVIPIVQTLKKCGARRFGVALLEEALEIKQFFPDLTVMVIGATPMEYSDVLVEEDIIPGIFSFNQAKALSEAASRQGRTARLHLKIDTGMGRIGFQCNNVAEILKVAGLSNLMIEGIYTHFATSDQEDTTFALLQLQRFNNLFQELKSKGLEIPIRHTANSAAILHLPRSHFELARPGIVLYGLSPSEQISTQLEPVLSWKARITHIKVVRPGETVSYGQTFVAEKMTTVATIPIGYADGLRRGLSNVGEVLIRAKRCRIIGRVCMDQTMIDVSELENPEIGELVTLIGREQYEKIEATEMAQKLDTINYEIVTAISKRVPRIYNE